MNIFWGIGAVFKNIRALFRKNFISLLIISSILQQYLLYVSTLPPVPFKVSAAVSLFWLRPPTPLPPKPPVVILEAPLPSLQVLFQKIGGGGSQCVLGMLIKWMRVQNLEAMLA